MKLPTEYLMRLVKDDKLKYLEDAGKVAIIMMGDVDEYTLEDLKNIASMEIISEFLEIMIIVYAHCGLDGQLIELYNKVKGTARNIGYFLEHLRNMDTRVIEESPIKQYIFNSFFGTAWKEEDFLIWAPDRCSIGGYLEQMLRHNAGTDDANYYLTRLFTEGLTPFDTLPEHTSNLLLKNFKRMIPFLKQIQLPGGAGLPHKEYLHYSQDTLGVKIPCRIAQQSAATMAAHWSIDEGKIILTKEFSCHTNTASAQKQVPVLAYRLAAKFPKHSDIIMKSRYEISFTEQEIIPLPDDMKDLEKLFKGEPV